MCTQLQGWQQQEDRMETPVLSEQDAQRDLTCPGYKLLSYKANTSAPSYISSDSLLGAWEHNLLPLILFRSHSGRPALLSASAPYLHGRACQVDHDLPCEHKKTVMMQRMREIARSEHTRSKESFLHHQLPAFPLRLGTNLTCPSVLYCANFSSSQVRFSSTR